MKNTALLSFEAISASLSGSSAVSGSSPPQLNYRIRLSEGESVNLSTGEKFADLAGHLNVRPDDDTSRPPAAEQTMGLMSYFEGHGDIELSQPPSYFIRVWIPRNQLEELMQAARLGKIPSRLHVEVEGMSYGYAPDGSEKNWDNKNAEHLKIEQLSFNIPLVISSVGSDLTDERIAEMPPTRAQLDQVNSRIDKIALLVRSGFWSMGWTVVIAAAILLFFGLRR